MENLMRHLKALNIVFGSKYLTITKDASIIQAHIDSPEYNKSHDRWYSKGGKIHINSPNVKILKVPSIEGINLPFILRLEQESAENP
jgi:hypothetical protein